jgi:GNAT superfamily N-acetyltransferase
MQIRLADIEDLQEVLNILNETTLDLLQKGINQWDYPWDHTKIVNQIKNKSLYVLLVDEKIIGTFCINNIDTINELSVNFRSKYLSQISILPEFQGKKFGSAIIDFACSFILGLNQTLYLDCWAGNEKLKEFYSSNGFECLGDFPEEEYLITIFKFN